MIAIVQFENIVALETSLEYPDIPLSNIMISDLATPSLKKRKKHTKKTPTAVSIS